MVAFKNIDNIPSEQTSNAHRWEGSARELVELRLESDWVCGSAIFAGWLLFWIKSSPLDLNQDCMAEGKAVLCRFRKSLPNALTWCAYCPWRQDCLASVQGSEYLSDVGFGVFSGSWSAIRCDGKFRPYRRVKFVLTPHIPPLPTLGAFFRIAISGLLDCGNRCINIGVEYRWVQAKIHIRV